MLKQALFVFLCVLTLAIANLNTTSFELIDFLLRSDTHNIQFNIGLVHMGDQTGFGMTSLACRNKDSSTFIVDERQSWKQLPVSLDFEFGPKLLPLHLINLTNDVDNLSLVHLPTYLSIARSFDETKGTIMVLLDCQYDDIPCDLNARSLSTNCVLATEDSSYQLVPAIELYSKIEIDMGSKVDDGDDRTSDAHTDISNFVQLDALDNMSALGSDDLALLKSSDPCHVQTVEFGNCVKERQDIRKCEAEQHGYMVCKKEQVLGKEQTRQGFAVISNKVCAGMKGGICPPPIQIPPGLGIPKIEGPVPPMPFGPDLGNIGGMIIGSIIQGVLGPEIVESTQNFVQIACKVIPPILTQAMIFGMTPKIDLSVLKVMADQMMELLAMAKAQAEALIAQEMSIIAWLKEQFNMLKMMLMELIAKIKALLAMLAALAKEVVGKAKIGLNIAKLQSKASINKAKAALTTNMDKLIALKSIEKPQTGTVKEKVDAMKNDIEIQKLETKVDELALNLEEVTRNAEDRIQAYVDRETEPLKKKMDEITKEIQAKVKEAEVVSKKADAVMKKMGVALQNTTKPVELVVEAERNRTIYNQTVIDNSLAESIRKAGVEALVRVEFEDLQYDPETGRPILLAPERSSLTTTGQLVSVMALTTASSTIDGGAPSIWGWNSGKEGPGNITMTWQQPVTINRIRFVTLNHMTGTHEVWCKSMSYGGEERKAGRLVASHKPIDGYILMQDFDPPLLDVLSLVVKTISLANDNLGGEEAKYTGWESMEVWSPEDVVPQTKKIALPEGVSFAQLYSNHFSKLLKDKGEKPGGDGALTQILVTDLSHTFTTLFTKLITKLIGGILVKQLTESLSGNIEEPIIAYLSDKLPPFIEKSVPKALDITVGGTLKEKLPEVIRDTLVDSLTDDKTQDCEGTASKYEAGEIVGYRTWQQYE